MGQTTEVGVYPKGISTPWGSYRTLDFGPGYQIKQLMVNPGQATSLQIHRYRDERWIVVSGKGVATRGYERIQVSEGSTVFIPFGIMHRLENPSDVALQILEVQYGNYLGEDDIVRLEDRYGRAESSPSVVRHFNV